MRTLPSLGKLRQDPNVPQWWDTRPIPVSFCSGKAVPFCVRTQAKGDVYPPDVDEAVRNFLALTDEDRLAASGRVFGYYRRVVEVIPDVDLGIAEAADVWEHLRAEGVSVDRDVAADGEGYVRVVYQCDWDSEHGFQILLRHGTAVTLVGEHEDRSFVE